MRSVSASGPTANRAPCDLRHPTQGLSFFPCALRGMGQVNAKASARSEEECLVSARPYHPLLELSGTTVTCVLGSWPGFEPNHHHQLLLEPQASQTPPQDEGASTWLRRTRSKNHVPGHSLAPDSAFGKWAQAPQSLVAPLPRS